MGALKLNKDIKEERLSLSIDSQSLQGEEVNDVEWKDNDIFRLRAAMLEYALRMIRRKHTSKVYRSWALWVFSNEISPFSFIVCCKSLGYDFKEIRESLIEMRTVVASDIQDHYFRFGRNKIITLH